LMAGIFITAAAMHAEMTTLAAALMYLPSVMAQNVVLMIFVLCNADVLDWGQREGSSAAQPFVSPFVRFTNGVRDFWLCIFPCCGRRASAAPAGPAVLSAPAPVAAAPAPAPEAPAKPAPPIASQTDSGKGISPSSDDKSMHTPGAGASPESKYAASGPTPPITPGIGGALTVSSSMSMAPMPAPVVGVAPNSKMNQLDWWGSLDDEPLPVVGSAQGPVRSESTSRWIGLGARRINPQDGTTMSSTYINPAVVLAPPKTGDRVPDDVFEYRNQNVLVLGLLNLVWAAGVLILDQHTQLALWGTNVMGLAAVALFAITLIMQWFAMCVDRMNTGMLLIATHSNVNLKRKKRKAKKESARKLAMEQEKQLKQMAASQQGRGKEAALSPNMIMAQNL